MAGFADLHDYASPALFPEYYLTITEHRDFVREFGDFRDNDGNLIDFTSIIATGGLRNKVDGSDVIPYRFVGRLGGFTVSLLPADTIGLVPAGATSKTFFHYLRLANGTDSLLQAWGPLNAKITVLPE